MQIQQWRRLTDSYKMQPDHRVRLRSDLTDSSESQALNISVEIMSPLKSQYSLWF